jgi:sorting nexin-1/2
MIEGGLTISVTDPLKTEGSGLSDGFVTYKVNHTSDLQGYSGSGTVTRRYNDFCWLGEILSLSVPGCIIPSLPPKQTVGRFSADFILARKRGLEKFMQRLGSHPELRESEYLRQFLQADDADFKNVLKLSSGLKPNQLNSLTSSLKSKWNAYVVTGKHIELEKDANSVAVDEVLEYITKIELVMARLVENAAQLTERSRKTAHSLREFGQGFVSYGAAEGSELGSMLQDVGGSIGLLSDKVGDHASEEIEKLLEPLAEQARVLASVRTAITMRAEKRQMYIQELTQLDALQVSYNKTQSQPGKEASVAAKAKQIEDCQVKADAIKAEFEGMTARLLKDFAEFQMRKCEEIQNILVAFVELQVRHHRESLSAWEAVSPLLEGEIPAPTHAQVPPDPVFRDVFSPDKASSAGAEPPTPPASSESCGAASMEEEVTEDSI